MKIKQLKQITGSLLSIALLSSCASTETPTWYHNNYQDDNYYYAIGEGFSIDQAQHTAINNINSSVWTKVKSSFSMDETHSSSQKVDHSNTYINNRINADTANISFVGIEFINNEKIDDIYYVKAKVAKKNVIEQVSNSLNTINDIANTNIKKLTHQDKLAWYLNHRNIKKIIKEATVYNAILSSLSPNNKIHSGNIENLLNTISQVNSDLLILISHKSSDKHIANFIEGKLAKDGIATTADMRSQFSHKLTINTRSSYQYLNDAHITTLYSDIKITNRIGNTISANEIIATGSSLSNRYASTEGAFRNFSNIVSKKGIWSSLGINNNK